MSETPFPPAPDGSELQCWEDAGSRHESPDESAVTIHSPDEQYRLTIAVDDPVPGFLIRLHTADGTECEPLSQMIVDDEHLAGRVAAEMAANATQLAEVDDQDVAPPKPEPPTAGDERSQETPDGWPDDEEDAWDDALEDAYEQADIPRSKGTVTTKTIDDRDYYYLQWRDGEKVKSQYIAPVTPR
jgi:hypothetical protein